MIFLGNGWLRFQRTTGLYSKGYSTKVIHNSPYPMHIEFDYNKPLSGNCLVEWDNEN